MFRGKDYSRARTQLEEQLGVSEKLGTRAETMRIRYWLATSLRLGGDSAQAATAYGEVIRILDDARKEPGAQDLLLRADLKHIYEDSKRRAQAKT